MSGVIDFRCPCGNVMLADSTQVGTSQSCSRCLRLLEVPDPAATAALSDREMPTMPLPGLSSGRASGVLGRVIGWGLKPRRLVGFAILAVAAGLVLGLVHRQTLARDAEHLDLARGALRRDDQSQALAELGEAIRLNPRSVEAYRERARLLLQLHRWEEAVADCTAALDFAEDADLYTWRAEAFMNLAYDRDRPGDFDRIVADASAALRLDPGHGLAYCWRGMAHSGKFDHEQALQDAEKAVQLAPGDPRVYHGRGKVRAARGETAQAVADFSHAIRLDGKYARGYAARGLIRLDREDRAQALADCQRAVQLAPRDAWVYLARGQVFADDKRRTEALADFDRVLQLDPRHVTAFALRATCHVEEHVLPKALADVNAALAINADSCMALAVRGLCRLANGRKTTALTDVRKAVKADAKNPTLYFFRALVFYQLGKLREAIEDCTRALKGKRKHTAVVFALRAVCHLGQNEPDRAVADCTRALALEPKNAGLLALRSVAKARRDTEAARADFDKAVRLDRRKAYLRRGETHLDLHAYPEALADLTEVIRLDPHDAVVYLSRATVFFSEQQGRIGEGLADCEKALQLAPQDPFGYRLRAHGHFLNKNYLEAAADCTRALDLDPEDVNTLVLRAHAYLLSQKNDQAIADAKAALNLESNDALAYVIRGLAHANQGKHDQATADLAMAVKLDSKFAELQAAYARDVARQKQQDAAFRVPQFGLPPELKKYMNPPVANAREPFHAPSGTLVGVAIAVAIIVFVAAVVAGFLKRAR